MIVSYVLLMGNVNFLFLFFIFLNLKPSILPSYFNLSIKWLKKPATNIKRKGEDVSQDKYLTLGFTIDEEGSTSSISSILKRSTSFILAQINVNVTKKRQSNCVLWIVYNLRHGCQFLI